MSNLSTPSSSSDDRNFDAELEYTFGFFPFLKPDNLALTCLLQGIRPSFPIGPREAAQDFAYCELGCGQGVTLNVLAAADAAGRYVGIDYNAAQIENARAFAQDAGLSNAEFIEDSFANLSARDLPDFDVIVLHGIYSWISEKLRQDIVAFVASKLKPGGLCFISYNCTIARGSDLALRQLLQAGLSRGGQATPEGVAKSLAIADEMASKGARYFSANTGTVERLKDARKRSPTYVFHEYFNPHWTPFFFHEVAADMARAQLAYAGMTNIAWNHPDLSIPGNLRSVFDGLLPGAEQELLKGIWTNQSFRRDIYVKGAPSRLPLAEQAVALKGLYFGLAKPREECSLKVTVPAGIASLPDKPFTALLDRLQASPVSGEDLRRLLPEGDVGDRDFVRALIILFGAEYAELKTPPAALARLKRRFDALNGAIAHSTDKSQDLLLVATPGNGRAVSLNPINYYLYRAQQTGPDNRVSKAYKLLTSSGRDIYYKGEVVKDRKVAELVIAESDKSFVAKVLARLRIA